MHVENITHPNGGNELFTKQLFSLVADPPVFLEFAFVTDDVFATRIRDMGTPNSKAHTWIVCKKTLSYKKINTFAREKAMSTMRHTLIFTRGHGQNHLLE